MTKVFQNDAASTCKEKVFLGKGLLRNEDILKILTYSNIFDSLRVDPLFKRRKGLMKQ